MAMSEEERQRQEGVIVGLNDPRMAGLTDEQRRQLVMSAKNMGITLDMTQTQPWIDEDERTEETKRILEEERVRQKKSPGIRAQTQTQRPSVLTSSRRQRPSLLSE